MRRAEAVLGLGGFALARACVVEDMSWQAMARRLRVPAAEIKAATAAVRERLAGAAASLLFPGEKVLAVSDSARRSCWRTVKGEGG